MLALKPFRDKAAGVRRPAQLESSGRQSGIVLCKDGSLLAGWFYRGPDIASSTDSERNWLSGPGQRRAVAARQRLGDLGRGRAPPLFQLPAPERSHFPDPVSRLVDEERRRQFLREGVHYESEYALIVQFTPPLRRKSKLVDI